MLVKGSSYCMQVNKVGVKVRSALITEIYRKALSVTTTTLSHFSTGQARHYITMS